MKIKFLSVLLVVFMTANVFVGAGAINKNDSKTNFQSKPINGNVNVQAEQTTPINATGFIDWERLFDSGYDDMGRCIQPTNDGGYIIVGHGYGYRVLLIKIDGNGNIEWERHFSNCHPDYGWYVLQTSDGGYLILAQTAVGGQHVWLIKTDENGTKEWERFIGCKHDSACRCIQPTRDGGYILVGYTSPVSTFVSCYDTWLLKIDSEGIQEWSRVFERPYYNWGFYVSQTSDDGFILTGLICQNQEDYSDLWLIKTDVNGYMEWNKIYGDQKPAEKGTCVRQTTDGGYIVAGNIQEPDGNILIKTDDEGNVIWTSQYGGNHVEQTIDGGYIVTGSKTYYTLRWPYKQTDLRLVKINSNGRKEWCRIYGESYNDVGNFVLQTENSGYIVVGTKQHRINQYVASGDVWIIKTGAKPTFNEIDMTLNTSPTNQQINQNSQSNTISMLLSKLKGFNSN